MTVNTSSSKLHPREVMLIRRLLVLGWSEAQDSFLSVSFFLFSSLSIRSQMQQRFE
jgi:hypothetical protein